MTEEPDFTALAIDDDRPRHPYVAAHPEPDLSAVEWHNDHGPITVEEQAWVSRSAYHVIESFLGHLTPAGHAYLVQTLIHRLNPTKLAEADESITPADLDPGGVFRRFEDLFGLELRALLEQVDAVLERCPGCGRKHGQIGWVHSATGVAVRVERYEAERVYFRRQVDGGEAEPRWTDVEDLPRANFDAEYVPGADVPLLG